MTIGAQPFAPKLLAQFITYDGERFFWREPTAEALAQIRTVRRHDLNRDAGAEVYMRKDTKGYFYLRFGGKRIFAHRLAWVLHTGSWPTAVIDHINHNRTDNRIANLRDVTQRENARNSDRCVPWRNETGNDVRFDRGKWRPRMRVRGRRIHLGSYDTYEQALAARVGAARVCAALVT